MRASVAALLAGAVVAATVGTAVVVDPEPAAADSHCPSPGGGDLGSDDAPADDAWVMAGSGWGHGIGMSQYGAQGAALLGCDAHEILAGFYQGVAVEARSAPASDIEVGIAPDRPDGGQPVRYDAENTGDVSVVWQAGDAEVEMPPGAIWRITSSDGETINRARQRFSEDEPWEKIEATEGVDQLIAVVGGSAPELTLENGDQYGRGRVVFDPRGDGVAVRARLPVEKYLLGVREVPSSFPAAAQQAQAITARSYAHVAMGGTKSNCGCHLYDSTSSQVYRGTTFEPASWVSAVDATSQQVMTVDGALATGYYASSHGGHSSSSEYVWGGVSSHHQPVDISRWEEASSSPHKSWRAEVHPEDGVDLGIGTIVAIDAPGPRDPADRIGDPDRGAGGLIVEGSDGTVHLSGEEARRELDLRSARFDVVDPTSVPVSRLAGDDRYETAAEVALSGFADASTVYVATGEDFPDALAGGAAAAAEDVPLLLTEHDRIPEATRQALVELSPADIVVLGGSEAVGEGVADELEDFGAVERRSGETREETAAAVVAAAFDAADHAVIATREDYPDALAGGALAADRDAPVLLTGRDEVPDATEAALAELGVSDVTVLGGSGAVSDAAVSELEGLVDGEVERIGGEGRVATGAAIAREVSGEEVVYVATAWSFPDALASAPVAARDDAAVVLVDPEGPLHADVKALLEERAPATVLMLGGSGAVSDDVVRRVAAAAE